VMKIHILSATSGLLITYLPISILSVYLSRYFEP
jgi:hypothetical protein